MKIGILDDSVVKDVVKILINRPEVINVIVEGSNLNIEAVDMDSLIAYLEDEHGLHLIVNGDTYMIASQFNEGLAATVANAGANAANAAAEVAGKAVEGTQRFLTDDEKDDRTEETEAEANIKARDAAKDVAQQGHTAVTDDVKGSIRALKATALSTSPDQQHKFATDPEMKKLLAHPRLVALLDQFVAHKQEQEDESPDRPDAMRSAVGDLLAASIERNCKFII
jgi:hypothetical protein